MDFVRIYYCSEFLLPLSVCLPHQGSPPCGRIIHRHIDRKCETLAEEKCVTSEPNREPESSSFAIFFPSAFRPAISRENQSVRLALVWDNMEQRKGQPLSDRKTRIRSTMACEATEVWGLPISKAELSLKWLREKKQKLTEYSLYIVVYNYV